MTKQKFSVSILERGSRVYFLFLRFKVLIVLIFNILCTTICIADESKVVIGVIDIPRLIRESDAGKMVLEQRQRYLTQFQGATRKEEKALNDADRELVRQRALLSPEALAEKQGAFRRSLAEFQRKVEYRRRNLDYSVGAALGQIEKKIVELVQGVARERSINLVLSQTQVYMFEPRFDITDAVMEGLNVSLPKVVMQDPLKMSGKRSSAE